MNISNRDIVQSEYEAFVSQYAPHALFASYRWGEVEKKVGHNVLRYGWFVDDVCIAVAQCLIIPSKRGTFFHVRHGPVLAEYNEVLLESVTNDLIAFARDYHADVVRIAPLVVDTTYAEYLTSHSWKQSTIYGLDAQRCIRVDLSQSDDQLLANFRKSLRYDVKKATASGFTVQMKKGSDNTEVFMELYTDTAKRHNFITHIGINEEAEVFGNDAQMFTTYDGDNPLSSALFLFNGDQAVYHHAASVPRSSGASGLMLYEAMKEAKKRGKRYMNLFGVCAESETKHPWFGLSQFKRGFGGVEIAYIPTFDMPLTWKYFLIYGLELWKKYTKGF